MTVYSLDNVLHQRLDAFVRGERSEHQLLQELTGLCVTPNVSWEALALIDQYHRRGRLTAEVARAARHRIERRLFGLQDVDAGDARGITQPAQAVVPRDLAPELATVRAELATAQRHLQRSRARVTRLLRFARSQRLALKSTRRELGVVSGQAAMYLEQLGSLQRRHEGSLAAAANDEGEQASVRAPLPLPLPLPLVRALPLLLVVLLGAAVLFAAQRYLLQPLPAAKPPASMPAVAVAPIVAAPPDAGELEWASERIVVGTGQQVARLQLQRSGDRAGEIAVHWWTEPAGARSGVDYVGVRPTRINLPEGEPGRELEVRILSNPERRHIQVFDVVLGNPQGPTPLGARRRATVFIIPG